MRMTLPPTASRTERCLTRALSAYGVLLIVDLTLTLAAGRWASAFRLASLTIAAWLIRRLWVEAIVAKAEFRTMQHRYTIALGAADVHRRRVRRVLAVLHTSATGEHAAGSRDFGRGVAHLHTLIGEALGLQETNPS